VSHLKRLPYEAWTVNSWWIKEISIQEDHPHIVTPKSPSKSALDVIQIFKNGTSRVIL